MKYLLFIIPILLSLMLIPPMIDAHQDGCHRWHSCPSDSGSYVCGDLGYDSECRTATYRSAPEYNYSMTVQTDKNSYTDDEKIIITINTATINSAVSIVMKNMYGDFVEMGQGKLEPRKTLTSQFTTGGTLMTEPGTYTITVVAVNNITEITSFEYNPSLKEQIENQISLEKIVCFNDLQLMLKNNGDLVCVSHSTMVKLLERNWGSFILFE